MEATTQKFEVRKLLTMERLREVLEYDAATGLFTWKVSLGNKAPVGAVAGSIGHYGYRAIRIDQRDHRAARLAFFYMIGEWPAQVVDHIDGDRSNDRWANLRAATPSQNCANSKRRSDQMHAKGVSFNKNARRWSASIQANGEARHLGLFDTVEDASAAYATAARQAFGEFARTV